MLLETVATGASETNLQLLCGIRDVAAVTVPVSVAGLLQSSFDESSPPQYFSSLCVDNPICSFN